MHARASTDEDLLPRLSQQERLFSNLDNSMKHEAGSLYGSMTLIAGAHPGLLVIQLSWEGMAGHACTCMGHTYIKQRKDNRVHLS